MCLCIFQTLFIKIPICEEKINGFIVMFLKNSCSSALIANAIAIKPLNKKRVVFRPSFKVRLHVMLAQTRCSFIFALSDKQEEVQ